jgi:hypothetical protein
MPICVDVDSNKIYWRYFTLGDASSKIPHVRLRASQPEPLDHALICSTDDYCLAFLQDDIVTEKRCDHGRFESLEGD